MMYMRLLLLSLIIVGSGSLHAASSTTIASSIYFTDTTVLTESSVHSTASLVKAEMGRSAGFSDLFTASSNDASNGSRLNPRATTFVQDYMVKNSKDLQNMKAWGRPYFSMIDGILAQFGLPRELKYLAVIESRLKPNSISWAGAVGPWQLMPTTARVLGLKVTHKNDERTNYYKSTQAAAKYLKDLYAEFGDWLLVIAAYNGGSGHIYSAMKKSGSRNFWDLQYYLPAESRNHVKKFIGTHYIFEGQGGITTLTKDEATEQLLGSSMYVFTRKISKDELAASKTMAVSGKYHSSVIAKYTLMDEAGFNRYNPGFDKVMASTNNTYELKLPADKMELFIANKYQILNESVELLLNAQNGDSAATRMAGSLATKE